MRVLGLTSYPEAAAATRFRMVQFVKPLMERGIELSISSFLSDEQFRHLYDSNGLVKKAFSMFRPLAKRIGEIFEVRKYDLIFVQREAMFFGPGIFEWLLSRAGNIPMVLDLDDATYFSYISPSYGRLGSAFKFFGKTDNLIRRSDAVICGNRIIAEHVRSLGTKAVTVPTIVDTDLFCPVEKTNEIPIVGWIGTHSTYPFLEWLYPVLERLAVKHRFILRVVGSGRETIAVNGVEVENRKWALDREIEDFQTLDIGLYPLTLSDSANMDWLTGKSGFKAIQYMAVGVPFVMSPVGVCSELGEPEKTHFNATSHEDWYNSLDKLFSDPELRKQMGSAGRRYSQANFEIGKLADILTNTLRSIVENEVPPTS